MIESDMNIPITIRLSKIQDLPFMISSWGSVIKHLYPNNFALDFSKNYSQYLSSLISRSTSIVAHLEGETDEIISFLTYTSFKENLICHFSYTKLQARNQGILRNLITFANPLNAPIIFTHPCKNTKMMIKFCNKWIFDPSIISYIMEQNANR